ncbi:hypothetical protein BFJ68_g958 [Fusarium oxysporum]|uniref:Uncharacterized protein n=2 Tax=Fusarium oxysporum TaxID=5507 RepID=A0A420S3G1_FUSOX|nr:hypothetical protein BFJ65_g11347 [Fusarium oxysporum f. sp. cepae]RKK57839.1 hypothetical protein BFJ67_g3262 [Fusarium oxysporum f. sp. cepae]RKK58417.1 hypothetical protein BFJ66_g2720 [Fusarium oxysporum f. sp. cepae]RKL23793.1 hypothetical protein BFJ68_g958 [Fusarium oxysporum]
MTEIEMDIDMAKPVLDGKIEDDFIDFDTDMVDSNHDLQKNDDNLESMDREMQEDEDAVNHEAYETNGITGEDVDFDLHDVEDTANSPEHVDYEVTEAPELGTQGPIQTAQPPDEDVPENEENVEILDEIIVHGDAVSDDHESTHEIDYEFEDNAESEDSHQDEKTAAASRATRSEPNGTAGAAEEQDDHEPENDATATGQELSDHTGDENNISSHNDQNEPRDPKEEEAEPDEVATGEAEAEDVKADEYNVENTHASDDNDEIHDGEDANSHEETTTLASGQNDETTEAVEEAEDHDYDVGEHVADAYDEHATTDTDHVDHSATGEDSNGKTDEGFPAITVQYKGDEFPMFSTTTHGFFANTSVLDEPLEKLIAGLRSELENEIAEDDDLVLQVDELGLELVETTQGETMSNVTLRQILEIFDLLVKNQDPDGSRPLYAYLFTKPNAEKRFEYLVESATAGKGLDEVIHLFETPMTAGTSMLETAATIDGVHEELDEFDSPIDDEHHSEIDEAENEDEYLEGEHANPDATGSEGQEFKGQEVDDHEVNSQQANNQDGHYEDDQDNINVATDTQIEISVNASAVDLEDPETAVDSLTAADEDGLEQNARADSEIDPFANFELDEEAEFNGDVALGENTETQDEVNVDAEPEPLHAQTNDTSTTTTLQEEEEASSFNVDLGVASATVETAEKSKTDDDDLDEIDWRDEHEPEDQAPSTPSAAGKRARGDDDDVDAEDEQDAKRRRP